MDDGHTAKAGPPPSRATYDGRRARRARNADSVVEAVVEMLGEGEGFPAAQAVAERAGVSLRSVFRYFDDLDALVAAALALFGERHRHAVTFTPPADPAASVHERVEAWVAHRQRAFALTGTTVSAALARACRDPAVQARLEEERRVSIDAVSALFAPELEQMDERERGVVVAALHSATKIEVLAGLSSCHGLDHAQIEAVCRRLVYGALGILKPADPSSPTVPSSPAASRSGGA